MQIHLVIVQPDNYVHSLGFLDTADYLQYWLEKHGLKVTMAKNRLRHDAVNLVFGAHLGFLPQWLEAPFCTFFFNLEQIGQGGAKVSPAYQALLKSGPVIDYHTANVASYRSNLESVPLIPFLNAPYLNPEPSMVRLAERPIDLLFFGSINAERKAFINRIEKTGLDVAVFDSPTYYHERDKFVHQAKAVINTSFYASARFEQVRAFNVLSQGTAFISYLQPGQKIEEDFREHVFWLDDKNFTVFFKEEFGKKKWCLEAQQKFDRWKQTNPDQSIENCINVLQRRWRKHTSNQKVVHRPLRIVQSEDGRYFHDAINLSAYEADEPDLTMNLNCQQSWPWVGFTRWGQSIQLERMQIEQIVIRQSPESISEWQNLLSHAVTLLKENGRLIFELPISQLDTSGQQGPTFKSGKSVIDCFAEKFWRSRNFNYRLVQIQSTYLDEDGKTCSKEKSQYGRFVMVKRITTSHERTLARVASPNFCQNFEGYPSD